MNLMTARPEDRVKVWRNFRQTLDGNQSDAEHLRAVATYWSRCPLVPFYIDWDRPENWPGPWEILNDGVVCPVGMAVLIANTLPLAPDRRWTEDRIRLRVLRDPTLGYLACVIVDGRYVLGLDRDGIVPVQRLDQATTIGQYALRDGRYRAAA